MPPMFVLLPDLVCDRAVEDAVADSRAPETELVIIIVWPGLVITDGLPGFGVTTDVVGAVVVEKVVRPVLDVTPRVDVDARAELLSPPLPPP